MSLLMQALKKAERSKLNSLLDEDATEKPSEAFDEVLALTPQDLQAERFPPMPVEISLAPIDEPDYASFEPELVALDISALPEDALEQIPAMTPAEEAVHDPTPPQSRLSGAGKPAQNAASLETRPGPAQLSSADTMHAGAQPRSERSELTLQDVPRALMPDRMPEPPFAPHASFSGEIAPALDAGPITPAVAAAPTAAPQAAPHTPAPERGDTRAGERRQGSGLRATDTVAGSAHAGAGNGNGNGAAKPGAAARARAAAEARAAAAENKVGWDPARIRLAVLGGVLLLIVALFGYLYWRATTAPGPGASLPMVPMPPPGAENAKQDAIVVPPPVAQAGLNPDAPPQAASAAVGSVTAGSGFAPAPHAAYGAPPGPQSASGAPAASAPVGNTVMATPEEIEQAMQMQAAQQGGAPSGAGSTGGAGGAAGAGWTGGASAAPGAAPGRRAEPAWSSSDIKVSHSSTTPRVSPALQSGYASLLAGDLAVAAEHYGAALRQDPNNRDALLGNAAVAVRRDDAAQASASYMRLLELNPSDADAIAGLLSLRPGDTGQSELRLKDLLRKSPDAGPLLFALGNLYSRQSRWTDAQQAYFRAYTANPDNPDYAFNLAVGLDRLNQPKLALNYYQRALVLAQAGAAGFDSEGVRARMRQLAETH